MVTHKRRIKRIDKTDFGYDITYNDSTGFFIPSGAGIYPRVGDEVEIDTRGEQFIPATPIEVRIRGQLPFRPKEYYDEVEGEG